MKKARAMYIPAGGKTAVWGPVDQNVLPEGYPYKAMEESVLADEAAISLSYSEETDKSSNTDPFSAVLALEDGKTYVVEWDGVKYTCPCAYSDTARANCIGNLALVNGTDNGMPFLIMYATANNMNVVVANGKQETPVVKVSVLSETIHPMAEEFLPALTSPNGTKYQLTVADDGTLSAVAVS